MHYEYVGENELGVLNNNIITNNLSFAPPYSTPIGSRVYELQPHYITIVWHKATSVARRSVEPHIKLFGSV